MNNDIVYRTLITHVVCKITSQRVSVIRARNILEYSDTQFRLLTFLLLDGTIHVDWSDHISQLSTGLFTFPMEVSCRKPNRQQIGGPGTVRAVRVGTVPMTDVSTRDTG